MYVFLKKSLNGKKYLKYNLTKLTIEKEFYYKKYFL